MRSRLLWALHLLFLLIMFQGPPFPFYGLPLISIDCIGKNILLKMERLSRSDQSEWLLPFCWCDGLRLLAHFRAPLKFLQGCKNWLGTLSLQVQRAWLPTSRGQGHQRPQINTCLGAHSSLGEGFFPKDLFLSFIPNCWHINPFRADYRRDLAWSLSNDIIYRGPNQNDEIAYILLLPQMESFKRSPSFKGSKNKEWWKEAISNTHNHFHVWLVLNWQWNIKW